MRVAELGAQIGPGHLKDDSHLDVLIIAKPYIEFPYPPLCCWDSKIAIHLSQGWLVRPCEDVGSNNQKPMPQSPKCSLRHRQGLVPISA
jgi:hypothetical protein